MTKILITEKLTSFEFSNRLAISLWRKGDFADARQVLNDILADGDALSVDEKVALYTNLAMVERSAGSYEEALKIHRSGLPVLDSCENMAAKAKFRNGLAITYWGLKRYDDAFEQYTAVSVLMETAGDAKGYAESLNNIGNLMVDAGNPTGAHEYLDRALKVCDTPAARAQIYDTRARACLAQGNQEEARRSTCLSLELTLEADEERLLYEHLTTFFEVGGVRLDVDKLRHAIESRDIRKALTEANGSVYRAASLLGLTCEGLRWKLEHQHVDLMPLRKPKRRSPTIKK